VPKRHLNHISRSLRISGMEHAPNHGEGSLRKRSANLPFKTLNDLNGGHVSVLTKNASHLQRTIGNKATRSLLLQRKPDDQATDAAKIPGTSSPAGQSGNPQVRSFISEGKLCEIPEKEWPEFCRSLNQTIARDFLPQVRHELDLAVGLFNTLAKLNEKQSVSAWFAELFGGTDFPSYEYFGLAEDALRLAKTALASEDISRASIAVKDAVQKTTTARQTIANYQSNVIAGAERTATGLEITAAVCFTIFNVAGGAVLTAPVAAGGAGMGALGAGVLASAGTTFLQSATARLVGPALYGDKVAARDVLGVAVDTGISAATALGSGAIMAKASGPLTEQLVNSRVFSDLVAKFGADAVSATIKNIIEGGIGNAVQGAFTDAIEAMRKNPDMTWTAFVTHLATNLIAGGIMGAVQGRIQVRGSGKRQIFGAGSDLETAW
jgi:hypothetical protein